MKKNVKLSAGIAAALAAVSVQAVEESGTELEEMVVTATRTPVPLAKVLSSVSVIQREEISALQPVDLVDVFNKVPGLDISRTGGAGAVASLFIRGSDSDHTLFLVDGQRMSSATLGSTSFQYFSPEQIERIEVVRGAHSSLYGSEAIGGVVQLFTRDGSGEPGTYLSGSTGSNNRYQVATGTAGALGQWRYSANVSYFKTDGIDNLVDDSGFNGDDDGYRNKAGNASLGYRFDNGADIALRYFGVDTRNEYDSAFSPDSRPFSKGWMQNINLVGRLPVTERWLSTLSAGTATDDSDNYDAVMGVNTGNFRTTRDQMFWQNDIRLAERTLLTLAYEYYDDEVRASSLYEERGQRVTGRDNEAWIAELQVGVSIVDLVLGFRSDDNESYGRENTANVSLGVELGAQHELIAGWAKGFKAPTFNDLYWPAGPFSAGNPDLDPETSHNWELGLRGDYGWLSWSLTGFDKDVDDLISWAAGDDFVYRPYNVSGARIRGGEMISQAELGLWRVQASYTYVEPEADHTHNVLPLRARSSFLLDVERDFDRWQLGLWVKAQGRRYADAANTNPIAGYGTLGLRTQYRFTQNLVARARVDNLFDKDYQLNAGYHQDGISYQLGLSYSL